MEVRLLFMRIGFNCTGFDHVAPILKPMVPENYQQMEIWYCNYSRTQKR